MFLQYSVDTKDIVAVELSLSNVTDAEVPLYLFKQARRRVLDISADGAYDTSQCYEAIRVKRAPSLFSPLEEFSVPLQMAFSGKGIIHVN